MTVARHMWLMRENRGQVSCALQGPAARSPIHVRCAWRRQQLQVAVDGRHKEAFPFVEIHLAGLASLPPLPLPLPLNLSLNRAVRALLNEGFGSPPNTE